MGVLKVLKTIGKGTIKGLDLAGDVLGHPAVIPLTMLVPLGWAQAAMLAIRRIDKLADEIRATSNREMSDEEKRMAFSEEFRAVYPEASDNDLNALGSLLLKFERGETEEKKD